MASAGENLLNVLTDQIITGALAPGDRLPSERNLATEYGASRTMVREALRTIEAQGLVQVRPGMGTFVTSSDVTSVPSHVETVFSRARATSRHVAVARIMLDVEAARLAAENATADDLASIEAALLPFESAATAMARADWDVAFHERVTSASHNPVLELMFASIRTYIHHLTLHSALTSAVRKKSKPLHRELYEAIAAGDAPRAQQIAAEHGRVALDLYGLDLDVPLSDLRH
jgi:DNA-binding FadR family transcriptional regulator